MDTAVKSGTVTAERPGLREPRHCPLTTPHLPSLHAHLPLCAGRWTKPSMQVVPLPPPVLLVPSLQRNSGPKKFGHRPEATQGSFEARILI